MATQQQNNTPLCKYFITTNKCENNRCQYSHLIFKHCNGKFCTNLVHYTYRFCHTCFQTARPRIAHTVLQIVRRNPKHANKKICKHWERGSTQCHFKGECSFLHPKVECMFADCKHRVDIEWRFCAVHRKQFTKTDVLPALMMLKETLEN